MEVQDFKDTQATLAAAYEDVCIRLVYQVQTNSSLVTDMATLRSVEEELHNTNVQLFDRNVFLQAEVDRLTAALALVQPKPKTLLGISSTGIVKIKGACQRWFDGGDGISKKPPRATREDCPRMHASWKLFGTTAPSDAQIISAFSTLLDGDKVEAEHETDVKHRKETQSLGVTKANANLAARIAIKNTFYDQVKRLREAGKIPKVDVPNTLSAWTFQDKGPKNPELYLVKADLLGVDLDGDDASDGMTDYGDPLLLTAIRNHANASYGGRWTVPEHGWNHLVAGDRMQHFTRTIPLIAKFEPEEIQLFDATGFSPLLTAAELAQYEVLVKQYNH